MTTKNRSNEGIINSGSISVGTLAVGRNARAISSTDGTTAIPEPAPPPSISPQQPLVQPQAQPQANLTAWDAFISHAHEDRDFVKPLVLALRAHGLSIWYDDSALHVGSSLREEIDAGLVASNFAIVVLSHPYFARSWTRQEVNGLFAREASGIRILLPVWRDVTREEVARFSPILADRFALQSSEGPQAVADRLVHSIRNRPA